jgi:glutathione S-transferase
MKRVRIYVMPISNPSAAGAAMPLFPRDGAARARVEEAERWGEQALQPVPRRLFRYLMLTQPSTPGRVRSRAACRPAPCPANRGELS